MFLTPDEVVSLTGRVRPSAQIRALRSMGVEHRIRPDGTPAVLRSALEPSPSVRGAIEPDWSALTAP